MLVIIPWANILSRFFLDSFFLTESFTLHSFRIVCVFFPENGANSINISYRSISFIR